MRPERLYLQDILDAADNSPSTSGTTRESSSWVTAQQGPP